jgi:hypothetical protein
MIRFFKSKRKIWEYKKIVLKEYPATVDLIPLGREGWELVCIDRTLDENCIEVREIILKREKI